MGYKERENVIDKDKKCEKESGMDLKEREGERDTHRDRQTDGQTNRQSDRHINRDTEGER